LASGHFARTEDSSEHATSSDPDNRNDDSDESEEHENRRTSASTSAQITESKRGISSGRNETSRHSENEEESEHDESDDDEDEDRGEHRSSTTASTSPTPAPTQQPATTPTYTTAQVAAHSTAASCYSIVNGSVYDLTRWISQHPGGSGAIKSMCGVDASAAFNGQHGGSPRPASELSGFKIGALAR
jgi:cytochrome b involved in lipid metabolism